MRLPSSTSISSAQVDGQSCGQAEDRTSRCFVVWLIMGSSLARGAMTWQSVGRSGLGGHHMLTRRTMLAASAAAATAPAVLTGARAATPKGVAVMAKQIDDI